MTLPHPALRRVLVRAAFLAVLAVVLYAGLREQAVPEVFNHEDKLYHVFGFAALAVCARLAFPRGAWWWQVLGALIIGGGIELLQNLEPARVGSLWDFLADAVGVGIAWLVLQLPFLRRWNIN